jgi:hypothetical protein
MDSSNKNIVVVGAAPRLIGLRWLAIAAQGCGITESKKMQARKLKTCLNFNCNIEHNHNNSFCSAECCKSHNNRAL